MKYVFVDSTTMFQLTNRRGRQTYTRAQTMHLEHEFIKNHYLTRTQRIVMSQFLNLSERQIKIWFQNRRMKLKRDSTSFTPKAQVRSKDVRRTLGPVTKKSALL